MAEQKEIASIEVLHLDDLGYGPEGKHTRREWRDECLTNLLAGKDQFLAWQESWKERAHDSEKLADFSLEITYRGGAKLRLKPVIIAHAIDFSGHNFEEALDCRWANFQFDTLFIGARFAGETNFGNSTFLGGIHFFGAIFSGVADFSMSTFSSTVGFGDSTFYRTAYFGGSKFLGNTNFAKTNFEGGSEFVGVIFDKQAYFENARFANLGDFEKAHFQTQIPEFRGCKIDATQLVFSDESYFCQDNYDAKAIKNISFLKRLADQHGQVDQAIQFNAMELRAKKALTWDELFTTGAYGTLNFWIFTTFYEQLSNYGRSIMRPFIWLLVIACMTWGFAFNSASDSIPVACDVNDQACLANQPEVQLSAERAATEYTLYRASGLIHFSDKGKALPAINQRLFGQIIEPWGMRIWGLFMSFASTILFFFIALALRNRYRIK